jgi:PKD repeat protein
MKIAAIITLMVVVGLICCSKAPLPTEIENTSNSVTVTDTKLIVTTLQENGEVVEGALVFFNGKKIGETPLEFQTGEQGILTIRVQKQHFLIYSQSITIQNEEVVYIEAILQKIPQHQGQLLITMNPDSCQIQVNNSDGATVYQTIGSEAVVLLPSAGYFVEVTKTGYHSVKKATQVVDDNITVENIHLEPLTEATAPQIRLQLDDSAKVNQPVFLQWQSSNALRVDIDYVTHPGLTGKREITFTTPGIRIITATAYNQYLSASVRDTVVIYSEQPESPQAPTLIFEVTPKVIDFGKPVQVYWQTDGSRVIIDQGIGMRGEQGREEVTFLTAGTKVFTAIAYGNGQLRTVIKDSVYVKKPTDPQLPVISLSVSDSAIVGHPVVFKWRTVNATQVNIDYVGTVGSNGKIEITFETPGKRFISATAYSATGKAITCDTVIIYNSSDPDTANPTEPSDPVVGEPILVPCGVTLAAYHDTIPQKVEEATSVVIQTAGYYRVVAQIDFNSGDAQLNESVFISVKNADGIIQWPIDANAGHYKVVADKPGAPHIANCDAGTFYFSKDTNTFQLYHYAAIAEDYPLFAKNPPINGTESVQVIALQLEFVKEK